MCAHKNFITSKNKQNINFSQSKMVCEWKEGLWAWVSEKKCEIFFITVEYLSKNLFFLVSNSMFFFLNPRECVMEFHLFYLKVRFFFSWFKSCVEVINFVISHNFVVIFWSCTSRYTYQLGLGKYLMCLISY